MRLALPEDAKLTAPTAMIGKSVLLDVDGVTLQYASRTSLVNVY